jgi:hypothetical protein
VSDRIEGFYQMDIYVGLGGRWHLGNWPVRAMGPGREILYKPPTFQNSDFIPDDGGGMFLPNVALQPEDYTAQESRTSPYVLTLPWKPQILYDNWVVLDFFEARLKLC